MAIHLDRQRPPKKRMGRLQRKGSKSNPRTGVQWANWLDVPGSGGGGGAPDPIIGTITPSSVLASAGATTFTIAGNNFESGSVVELDQIATPTTFVDSAHLTIVFDPTVAVLINVTVRNPSGKESNDGLIIVSAGTEEDAGTQGAPTSSWLKADIIEWLTTEGGYEEEGLDSYTKAELLDLVEG